jgi:hypothetical protein
LYKDEKPIIGILCWEEGTAPRGLVQLESFKGNSTNPDSYDFPVIFSRVPGANIHTILEKPDIDVMKKMVTYGKKMIEEGARAIVTSCGFNAIFQKELAKSLTVPVATSSLMQIPFVATTLSPSQTVAVITANKKLLTRDHFQNAGVPDSLNVSVLGMEECLEWNKIFTSPDENIDLDIIREEVVSTASDALERDPSIGAFVLECTDLPPFSQGIRKMTGLPVFDFITMVRYLVAAIGDY